MPGYPGSYSAGQRVGYTTYGPYTAASQLPNVSGSTTQTGALSVGDQGVAAGVIYWCTDATQNAAKWSIRPIEDPYGRENVEVASTSALTPRAGTTRVLCTFPGTATTITLPDEASAPIGTKIVVQKANVSANAINVGGGAGVSINGGVPAATMAMPGSTAASSTTTNDIAAVYTRDSATSWRCSAA